MRVRRRLVVATVVLASMGTAIVSEAHAAAPPALSADHAPAVINSSYGGGDFGRWIVDPFDLPAYRYTINEIKSPMAEQAELAGATRAQHQVGNDHIKGMAYNDGYTEFWSQDRLSQWANLYQPASHHYAGGYGYLNIDGHLSARSTSTGRRTRHSRARSASGTTGGRWRSTASA